MNFLFIQEAGAHGENRLFRENLCLKNAMNRIDGHSAEVWGLNYPLFDEFDELEKWADVIFVLENYSFNWLPVEKILNSKKIKIYWSIDSHCTLPHHVELNKSIKPHIHLNSTEFYLPYFNEFSKYSYWFPNAYPKDLIQPIDNVEKKYDLGFCGNMHPERVDILTNHLKEFNPKIDSFVLGNDMVKAINSYKIHFNRSWSGVNKDINYRNFETLGCKTFLITSNTPGLEKLFEIDKDLVTWDSIPELKEKIKYYLDNPVKRKEIEEHGHKTALSKHTYDERCKYLLRIISGTNI